MDATLLLFGLVLVLLLANAGLSLLPRKSKAGNVVVSFVPPASAPLSSFSSTVHPSLDAHILSSNQKISLLFSRVEKMERDVQQLFEHLGLSFSGAKSDDSSSSDSTWIETVPIRKRRKKV